MAQKLAEKDQIDIEPARSAERNWPLSDQALMLLRRKILRGDITPGAKLKVEDLQRELEVSSSPLREALNRLLTEGLVVASERRGFRVAPISVADLLDITAFRLAVETAALTECLAVAGDEWEGRVVAAFHRLERVEARMKAQACPYTDEWTERHKDFHMALLSACSSTRLKGACSSLFDQAERYRRLSAQSRKQPRDTMAEHRRLMKSALARDPVMVDLLRTHISKTAEHVASVLSR